MCNVSPRRLQKIHDPELLTLHWHSFSWWGRERFTFSFAYTGSQYFVYDNLQPIAPQITEDTWPRIFDAPLTLIMPGVYPQYAIIHVELAAFLVFSFTFFLITTLFFNDTYKYIL